MILYIMFLKVFYQILSHTESSVLSDLVWFVLFDWNKMIPVARKKTGL